MSGTRIFSKVDDRVPTLFPTCFSGRFQGGWKEQHLISLCFKGHPFATPVEGVMGAGILFEGGEVDVWGDFDGGSFTGRFGGGSSKEYALDLCFKGHEIATPLEGVMGAGTGVSGEGGEGGPSIGRFSVSQGDFGGNHQRNIILAYVSKGMKLRRLWRELWGRDGCVG